ncbi:Protein CBG15852 [Caenorhabditis briggsae]|uniref:Protein CBG15852 n=1 Tax=Caenorhabditis briggsae TaxID=6238 RepID=A8XMW1_CAEBR|nr:Protein CBG15852 [Caenorhabditis briggsae]CAP33986.2 Protein CBG15852 [Caenorhabditis briggsae]
MSQEGVPVKRRRENDPDEQPELRELIEKNTMVTDQIKKMEMNITEIKAMVNNQEKNILKKMEKLETQINAENKGGRMCSLPRGIFPWDLISQKSHRRYLSLDFLNVKKKIDIFRFTLEGIMLLNDVYDVRTVGERCQEYLMEKSQLNVVKKMKLVSKYRNEELTEKLISEIKTLKEYKSIVADGVDDFSLDVAQALLKKSLSLQ